MKLPHHPQPLLGQEGSKPTTMEPNNKSGALEGRIELSNKVDSSPKDDNTLKPIEPLPNGTPPTPPLNKGRSEEGSLMVPARKLPWWSIVGVLALLLLTITVWKSLGSLTISPNPAADKITVNGKQVQAGKKLLRLPGAKAQVTIEKQGYVIFEKNYKFGYSTELTLAPKLKQFPPASLVSKDVAAPVFLDKDSDGVKTLSAGKNYILKHTRDTQKVRKLNLEAIAGINSFQFPTDQNFALLERSNETGVLDFARVNVTSQGYKKFADNILAITLSPDGKQTMYLEHNKDTNQNYLVRDDIRHETPDRYFDEAQLKELGLSEPKLKWSPNGKTVMAIGKDIVLIDLLNRKADKIILGTEVADAWFVPNSSIILVATFEKKLLSFDTSKIPADSGQDANPPAKTSYNHPNHPTLRPRPASVGTTEWQANKTRITHEWAPGSSPENRDVFGVRTTHPNKINYSLSKRNRASKGNTVASVLDKLRQYFSPSIARAADGKTDLGLIDYGIYVKPETVAVVDSSNIIAVNNKNQLIGYNFTLKKQVTYLLGKGVDADNISSVTVDAKRNVVYLLVGNSLYSQALESSNY